MPDNLRTIDASIARSRIVRDPQRRFTDLAIIFEVADGANAGWRTQPYGGRWDVDRGEFCSVWNPAADAWTGDPVEPHIIQVAQQSIEAIEDWEHAVQLIMGGRRSGKTTGTLAPKVLVLLLVFVGLPGCVLSPTYRQSMNVWRALIKLAPAHFWAAKNKTERRLTMVNGAEVVLLSADRDDSARSEGCAWQVNDERQDISEEAASNAQLSASEAAGVAAHIVVETATIKPELRDHYDKVVASARGAVYFMGSYGNPFIDHSFLDAAKEFLDEERILREIEGRWPEVIGRVYYPYDEAAHVRDQVQLRDITAATCLERFDHPAEWVVSVDPPHHATVWKVLEGGVVHVRHEVVIGADQASGDVEDLAKRSRLICGKAPAVVVADPHETHYDDDVRKYFKQQNFRIVLMPRVNIEYRITAVRARLRQGKLLVASACTHLREALRDQLYDTAKQKPRKDQLSKITSSMTVDHIADALGYGIYKFWPARLNYEALERQAA